jgi:hypothetical protein
MSIYKRRYFVVFFHVFAALVLLVPGLAYSSRSGATNS